MARKKSRATKKVSYKRRKSSMAGINSSAITSVLAIGAGAIVANQLDKFLKFDKKILAAGKIVIGVMLPKFAKSPLMSNIGTGMIAVGASQLVSSFVPALGAADDVVVMSGYDYNDMSGLDTIGADISEVNGFDVAEVNGYDEY